MTDLRRVIDDILAPQSRLFVPKHHPLHASAAKDLLGRAARDFVYPEGHSASEPLHSTADIGFLNDAFTLEPMAVLALDHVLSARTQLCRAIDPSGPAGFYEACLDRIDKDWVPYLLGRLADMSRQTLVLEYNVDRLEHPDRTIADYLADLRSDRARQGLLEEYPVLAERLAAVAAQQTAVFKEFMARLPADWDEVRQLCAGQGQAPLPKRFGLSQGDTHNGGRAVIIIAMTNDRSVVYKPRDLSIERAFNDLLGELNAAIDQHPFRQTQIIHKGDYGWVEYITEDPCQSVADCAGFYTRIGGLLALVHLLGGFDLHHENIIAAGADPVIVDLETLFHSFKNGSYLGKDDPFLQAADYPAVKVLLSSVMNTLMLPQNARSERVSGIDGTNVQDVVARRYDHDRNRFDYEKVGQKQYFHRPFLKGAPVEPGAYLQELLAGYERIYRHFLTRKTLYRDPAGSIGRMADTAARVVVRDTQIYTNLIEQSYHPTLLQHASARWVHFLNIWQHASQTPTTIPLVPQEVVQMYHDDIPYFMHHPKAVPVQTCDGTRTGYDYDVSGYDFFLKRLADLSEKDLSTQVWIIAASVATDVQGAKPLLSHKAGGPADTDQIEQALSRVHQTVIGMSFEDEQMLDWLTVTPTPEERLAVGPVDITLYNGISGLVFYLAYYAQYRQSALARDQVHKALNNLRTQLSTDWDIFEIPGAMNGLGGPAYLFTHLAVLWSDETLMDDAFRLLDRCREMTDGDPDNFDFIGGSAGLICVALSAYDASGQDRFLTLAQRFGDLLLRVTRHDAQGAYWAMTDAERPLTGLSHGFAGLSYALARLNAVMPEPRYARLIQHMLDRENADFVQSAQNWLDWRYANLNEGDPHKSDSFQHFWCNGSAGIGLSRLGLWASGWQEDSVRDDIIAAASSTAGAGLRHNHSLCHGDLGNLDFLRQAAVTLGDEVLLGETRKGLGEVCRDILKDDMFGGASRIVAPPDLMTGLCGIGYGLLRQLDPQAVPDLLLLCPPAGRISP